MLRHAFDANQPETGRHFICVRSAKTGLSVDVMKKLYLALGISLLCSEDLHALDREQRRAQALLKELCGACHAVGRTGRSPHAYAPAFRNLGENKLYEEDFGQRLQSGL